MTELEKARYNATKKAKDEKAKIKQALPIGGLLNFLEGGARPRAIVGGLLGGDTTALNGLLGEVKQLADPNYMRNVKGMSEQDAINIALDANPIMAGTMKGNIIDAIAPKTKYELAHELAQKNAVEMLGLHPNNTAMDRAKALGFDTKYNALHGTTSKKDFKSFNNGKNLHNELGAGIYVTSEPLYANSYAQSIDNGRVIPTLVKGDYYNKAQTPDFIDLAKRIIKNDGMPETGKGWQTEPVEDFANFIQSSFKNGNENEWLKRAGYSGVHTTGMQQIPNQRAVFDQSSIRSRFAAFDPARAHEADLLGMASPEMLGLLALGSGAGVAYANSRKDKKGNNK